MGELQDDFQFKPLTEGLGFHKKKVELSQQVKSAGLVEMKIAKPIPNIPKPLLEPALPRKDIRTRMEGGTLLTSSPEINSPTRETPSRIAPDIKMPRPQKPMPTPTTPVEEVLKNLSTQQKLDFVSGPVKRKKSSYPNGVMASAFLDGLVVVALCLMSMILALAVTKVDFVSALLNRNSDPTIFVALGTLVFGMGWIYPLVSRLFAGSTLGEWVFEIQVGTREEQNEGFYGLKLMTRGFVMLATGYILIPILSSLFKKDLASTLCGISLAKKETPLG